MQAYYLHETGDDAGAIEAVQLVLRHRDALYWYPDDIGHLVALGSGWEACSVLWRIMPTLRISASNDDSRSAVSQGQIRKLIDDLLDESSLDASVKRVCQLWRMRAAGDPVYLFARDKDWSARVIGQYFWMPRGYQEGLFWLELGGKVGEAATEKSWPDCEGDTARLKKLADGKGLLIDGFVDGWQHGLRQDYLFRTGSRLTAVALAMRLYEMDHNGRLPSNLDLLVPRYLPHMPADPMSTGAPLHFRGGDDPAVYSVGDNGVDDGGSDAAIKDRRSEFYGCFKDIVLHLRGEKRTMPEDYFVHDGLQYRMMGMIYAPPVQTESNEKK